MSSKNIIVMIISILFVAIFGFVLIWGIINFEKVKAGLSGTGLYTEEDLKNAHEDGYNEGLSDKEYYDNLVNSYRDKITNLEDNVSQLNSQITILTSNNKDYQNQIDNLTQIKLENEESINSLNEIISQNEQTIETLTNEKTLLQTQVKNLINEKENNELTITSLNSQILTLQKQVESLTTSSEDKAEEINRLNQEINELESQVTILTNENAGLDSQILSLNSQIKSLQSLNDRLQDTNESNLNTITTLNNQIKSLNSQITELSNQLQSNTSNVTALNNKIAELEKSIAYYEQYIASLESGEQVVATFEFNGSVYNIQIVNKNSSLSVVAPTSTEYVIFNGWTVNGESVDLSTYQITTNTKFVADVTLKYDVIFMSNDSEYNKQIITKDNFATLPTAPTKDGYEFDGWSIDGINLVDVESYKVTGKTIFVAVFTKLHNVSFVYEEDIISTQTIRNNNLVIAPEVEDTSYKVFNGWFVNDTLVDLSTYKIIVDTTFVASITYFYDVKFMLDDEIEYDSQIIEHNHYANLPSINPTKENYVFEGWSLNKVEVIENINTTPVNKNTIYYAIFRQNKFDVNFVVDDIEYSSQKVLENNYITLPEEPTREGYAFEGWSLNKIDVIENINSISVTSDTTYYAVWSKLHTVKFIFKGETINTQQVKNNEYAKFTFSDNSFKYWSLSLVNVAEVKLSSYKITQDTFFYGVEKEQFEVQFYDGDSLLDSINVYEGDLNLYDYKDLISEKEGYTFAGWVTSYAENNIINSRDFNITTNTKFYAQYEKLICVDNSIYDLSSVGVLNLEEFYPDFDFRSNQNFYLDIEIFDIKIKNLYCEQIDIYGLEFTSEDFFNIMVDYNNTTFVFNFNSISSDNNYISDKNAFNSFTVQFWFSSYCLSFTPQFDNFCFKEVSDISGEYIIYTATGTLEFSCRINGLYTKEYMYNGV